MPRRDKKEGLNVTILNSPILRALGMATASGMDIGNNGPIEVIDVESDNPEVTTAGGSFEVIDITTPVSCESKSSKRRRKPSARKAKKLKIGPTRAGTFGGAFSKRHSKRGKSLRRSTSQNNSLVSESDVENIVPRIDPFVINLDSDEEGENQADVVELSDDECIGRVNKWRHMEAPVDVGTCSGDLSGTVNLVRQTMAGSFKLTKAKLRPIVIDGCNVAFGHGKERFSSRGLKICIDFFKRRGHQVTAFVPQFRRRHYLTDNPDILDSLEREGTLVFTPSRCINGKRVTPYDDRFIVDYADQVEGVIVSRDNFRDLAVENPSWSATINNRLLMFTWANDIVMFPQDPLGRNGPTLDDFLSFPN